MLGQCAIMLPAGFRASHDIAVGWAPHHRRCGRPPPASHPAAGGGSTDQTAYRHRLLWWCHVLFMCPEPPHIRHGGMGGPDPHPAAGGEAAAQEGSCGCNG